MNLMPFFPLAEPVLLAFYKNVKWQHFPAQFCDLVSNGPGKLDLTSRLSYLGATGGELLHAEGTGRCTGPPMLDLKSIKWDSVPMFNII